jgi:hypothetical protein
MRVLAAGSVAFSLFLGFYQEVKGQEFISLPQAEGQGAPAQELSWEEREFERIMRLRAIHAGTRPVFPQPAPLVPMFFVIPPTFPTIQRFSFLSPGCRSGTAITIIDRRKRDRSRK